MPRSGGSTLAATSPAHTKHSVRGTVGTAQRVWQKRARHKVCGTAHAVQGTEGMPERVTMCAARHSAREARGVCSARGHRSCSRGIVLRRHSFWYGRATALQLGNPLLKTCDLAILFGALLQHLCDQRLGLLLRCLRDSRVRHAQLYVHARVAIEPLRPRRTMVSTTCQVNRLARSAKDTGARPAGEDARTHRYRLPISQLSTCKN